MKNLIRILFGFGLIVVGIWLLKDFVIPFFKVFAGVILIGTGLGFLFSKSASHIRYKVR